MDYTHIFTQMLMIFATIMVGFLSAKRGIWPAELNRLLSVFVLDVSCPMLILASVMGPGITFETSEVVSLIWVSVVNYALLIAAAFALTRLWNTGGRHRRGQLRFMSVFGNVTFIGFPVVNAVFGAKAVFYAAVLTIPFNVLIFTVGVSFLTGLNFKQTFSPRLVFSPCVLASLAAMVLALLRVEVPEGIGTWCHLVGDMTIPCALLIIGASLSTVPLRDMAGSPFVYAAAFIKLLLMPALVLGVLRALGVNEEVAGVATLLSGMPIAANGIMISMKHGLDGRLMAQAIFITTLMAAAAIPLIVMWL